MSERHEMNDALNLLQTRLARSFAAGVRAPETWTDPAGMSRALTQVQREHGGAGITADSRSITSAIADFRRTGTVEGIRDLKYVCLGVGLSDARGWCVLADPKLRNRVTELVAGQPKISGRLRCFQALLSSYWMFPKNDPDTKVEASEGWRELGIWLRAQHTTIARSKETKPQWFGALTRHIELLGNEPCSKFGADLLRGDPSGLEDAIESLAIPRNSWVLEEAIFAHVKAATEHTDERFKEILPRTLAIASGKSDVEIGIEPAGLFAACKAGVEHGVVTKFPVEDDARCDKAEILIEIKNG